MLMQSYDTGSGPQIAFSLPRLHFPYMERSGDAPRVATASHLR
jgi:hypothetical protein